MALDPALSELDGGPIEYAPSLWAELQDVFKKHAARNAVISLHQAPNHLSSLVGKSSTQSSYLTWSYEQLLRGGVTLAAGWQEAGIKTDDVIATLIPNGADHCVLRMAGVIGKLNFAALDAGMTSSARTVELQNMLTLLKPAIVVVIDEAAARSVDVALETIGWQTKLKLDAHWDKQAGVAAGWVDLDQIRDGMPLDSATYDALLEDALVDDHDRVSSTLFTSGTSMGKPKGCPKTVLNTIHTLRTTPQRLPGVWTVRLVDTANFRAICNLLSLTVWADEGTFVISSATPSPASMIHAIEETKVTDVVLLPLLVRLIRAHPDYSVEKVKSMTTVAVGGDVVTRAMLQFIEEVFPNSKAYNAHGSTEGAKIFEVSGYEQTYFGEVPALGPLHAGVRMKVVNEDGNVVARGTPGEMHLSSAAMISHYLEGVNQSSFYHDGQRQWFNTGDTVVVDKEGHIYMVGRTKDIIKRVGVPITPGVVETCLAAYTNAVVTVVDIPHAEYGAEPYAIMSTMCGKTIDELKARVVEMLGPDYALGGVVVLKDLGFDAWPLNATDKVNKIELKKALRRYLGE